ncbi:hypothetical protein F2Q69_00059263 [Brassica cretica]|uniref:Uncharacterized protein n=1 Tax=Brassica cretica TaxID=69181 RepID=A0A8S9RGN1_BRACR|nr:hypothetical protein F2Q69_00059263 [Brassica cretica]
MKVVLSFIAKDVVAKGLDHDTFVLSIRSSREIKPKKLDTEPVRSQLRVCKLVGFLKTLEYWQRDKFWDLVSRFLILCLEMLETSALGLGQDLGLLLVVESAMTNSTYVSHFSFILIPYRFKVRNSSASKERRNWASDEWRLSRLIGRLFTLFPREIMPKKLDTEPVRSQLWGDFLLGRDQAE